MSSGGGGQGGYGGTSVNWQPQGGGYRHAPQMSDQFTAGNDVMPTMQPQTGGTSLPQQPQAPTDGGRFGFGPYGVQDRQSGEFYGGPRYKRYGTPPRWQNPPSAPQGFGPQGFTGNEWKGGQQGAIDPGRNMTGVMAPGFNVNQQAAQPQAPQQPQQSFEQFQQTLGNGSGMTYGQQQDAYQKSLQPQNGIYNGNIGPGGTQNPYPGNPNPFPAAWGQQTYGFDPKAMAGKQIGADMGWFYGRDSIGRTVGNDGTAMAGFSPPADGFQRRRPWMG